MRDRESFWDNERGESASTGRTFASGRDRCCRPRRMGAIALGSVLLLALAVVAVAAPGPIIDTPGYDANPGPVGDDVTLQTALPFDVNFLGTTRTDVWMCSNGYVTLDGPNTEYNAVDPLDLLGNDVIAPFFTDLRAVGPPSTMSYGTSEWNGRTSFSVNWIDCPHYSDASSLHTFQLVLVDRSDIASGDFDMMFNYWALPEGTFSHWWERVGWSNAAGDDTFEFPGSGAAGPFHDGQPTALTANSTNTTPGRYYFMSRAGAITTDTVPPTDPTLLASATPTATPSNVPTITVTWSADATDNAGSGVDGFSYSWSIDDTETPPAAKSLEQTATAVTSPVLADGTWWFNLATVDAAGNWTATEHLGPFEIDTTPPVTTDDAMPYYLAPANISLTATDTGGSGVDYTRWRLDGSALATGTAVATDTVGVHQLDYFSVDLAGNQEATKTTLFEVVPDPCAFPDEYWMNEDDLLVVGGLGVLTNDLYSGWPMLTSVAVEPSHGEVVMDALSGGFIYVPDNDYNGTDEFRYLVTDMVDSSEATVTVNIAPVADDPWIVSQAMTPVGSQLTTSIPEEGWLDLGAIHGEDVDGDDLFWSIASEPAHGMVSLTATAATDTDLSYWPDPDFTGTDDFTLVLTDETGLTDTWLVTVNVTPVNDPPVAVDDEYYTSEDTTYTAPYTGWWSWNDYDIDGDLFTSEVVTPPSNGTLDWQDPQVAYAFQYVPDPDWNGTDYFTYRISDGTTWSVPATGTIYVEPVNDAPTDIDLSNADIDENMPAGSVVGTVGATDIDSTVFTWSVEGADAASFEIVGNELRTTESFDYEAKDTYTITLVVEDEGELSYSEPAVVTVLDVNEPPVAVDDEYTISEDGGLVAVLPGPPATLLANDSDPESDSFVWVDGWTPPFPTANGNVFPLSPLGEFAYFPDPNFYGTDTFTYQVIEDATPENYLSNVATVTITVESVNDPPVPVDDSYSVEEDGILVVGTSVLDNDSDPIEGDALSAWLNAPPSNGDVLFNEPAGTFVYVPDEDYSGPDSFTYLCDDGTDAVAATVNIAVTPVNDDPVITQGSSVATSTPEDSVKGVALDATDADGDPLTWALGSDPEHGVAVVAAGPAGSTLATYAPDPDYNGLDSFEVVVSDGNGGSDIVLVSVTVTPVNDPPVAMPDTYTIEEDGYLYVPSPGVLDNDYDIDGDDMWWMPDIGPLNGTWFPIAPEGEFAYQPDPDWNGTDYFIYHTEDVGPWSSSAQTTVTIIVTPVNDAPTDIDLSNADIDENLPAGSLVGTFSATDIDSSSFTYSLEGTDSVAFQVVDDELQTAMPLNFEVQASYDITVTADDGAGGTYSELFTITVNDVNDVPVAVADDYTTAEDTTLTVAPPGLLLNDSDEDGDPMTIVLGAGPFNGSLEASLTSGGITYTPDPDWFGTDTFEYSVTDGLSMSATVTVTIEVTSVNDIPVAADDAYTMDEDTVLQVDLPGVLDNDFDVEGPMLATLDVDATYGALVLDADGSFTYEPEDGWSGVDEFTYRVFDGDDYSAPATVIITVQSVDTTYESVAGATRIGTAIQASKKAFPGGADTVVVCTGYNWPDALGGSALAGVVDGPVLLTATNALPSEVLGEIRRLHAGKAIVLGGPAAVSSSVFNALKAELGSANVSRIGGADRYETAILVARSVISRQGGAYDGNAFAATGVDFPDALSASPLAAAKGWPIYLVRPASSVIALRTEMQSRGVTDLVVLGGKSNVSIAAQNSLEAGPIATTRVSGSDRYSTCAAIATYGVAHAGLGWNGVAIATGNIFPDALSGGVFAFKRDTVLLLTPGTSLHSATGATLAAHRSEIERVSYLGGLAAITQEVRDDITALLR